MKAQFDATVNQNYRNFVVFFATNAFISVKGFSSITFDVLFTEKIMKHPKLNINLYVYL